MVAAGTALLDAHNPENAKAAGAIFQSLYDQDDEDRAAIAGLIAAYSITDPTSIPADLLSYLPEASRLVADVDAAALEAAGVPTSTLVSAPATKKRSAPSSTPAAPHAKRIRKVRMPKDFDPNKKIDPERWLPMRDRTYYRPRGKKGKKRAEGLTQGGPVAEEKAGGDKKAADKDKKGKKKGKGKW
jgi:signal recognition particle subunit SRP72